MCALSTQAISRSLHLGACLLAASLLGACPPASNVDDIPEGADAGVVDAGVEIDDVIDAADYCETIIDFFCPYYVRCGRMAAADVEACRAIFAPACNARYEPTYVALAASGLLSLSAAGVDGCRAHLEQVACEEQLFDIDGPCVDMWIGAQPEGGACGLDIESFVCAPGTACELDVTLCGSCARVVADGASCVGEGVTCARDSACTGGVCVARRQVGEACGVDDRCVIGARCADDGVCRGPDYVAVGAACDFEHRCPFAAECIDGSCRAAVGLSASCDALVPCDSGAWCDDGVCAPLVASGGACTSGVECQTGACDQGEDDAAGACAAVPGACFP